MRRACLVLLVLSACSEGSVSSRSAPDAGTPDAADAGEDVEPVVDAGSPRCPSYSDAAPSERTLRMKYVGRCDPSCGSVGEFRYVTSPSSSGPGRLKCSTETAQDGTVAYCCQVLECYRNEAPLEAEKCSFIEAGAFPFAFICPNPRDAFPAQRAGCVETGPNGERCCATN